MHSAANQDAYGNPAWGRNPWGNRDLNQPNSQWTGAQWVPPPFWHPAGMSRPVAIAFTVLGFMFWWPVGLAILFYMLGTGRMGCFGRRNRRAMWEAQDGQNTSPWGGFANWATGGANARPASSGNFAFDEYKKETLRRLEEEQQEFGAFLERLRFARDKAEFDQFMAERRTRPAAPPAPEQPDT